MIESEWVSCKDHWRMLKFLEGRASDRKLRLLAVTWCIRAKSFVEDECHAWAEVAEAYAEGQASVDDLHAIRSGSNPYREPGERTDRIAFYDTADPDQLAMLLPDLISDLIRRIAWSRFGFEEDLDTEEVKEMDRLGALELGLAAAHVRDAFGNPFRPAAYDPALRSPLLGSLAQAAYEQRSSTSGHLDDARLAVLGDALEEVGCDDVDILGHLRSPGPHIRGCWALDLILEKK